MAKRKLKIIPIGGLSEIGKNMTAFEYGNDIIVVDAGLMFPGEDMLGIDLVIPDISYLVENQSKVRGIFLTHGHEDHIGALPYVLSQINVPVYATKLTRGLVSVKLKERKVPGGISLKEVASNGEVKLGSFSVTFFPVCHSIPDASGLIIRTPVGIVVHSGDFKLDHTPVSGRPADLSGLARLGSEGILLLMSDSTYAEMPGYTPSEQVVGETLDRVMAEAPGRMIVTTFSSLISRVQQVIDAAHRYHRKVCVMGRSMINTSNMAMELGYLNVPDGTLVRPDEAKVLPLNKVVYITTGSQGEPTSALVRIANRDYPHLHIIPGDTVVISASPIPGNEALVNRTVDSLFRQGAEVMYGRVAPVHVHGHASQEELKLLLSLAKPKFFMPVHGEYRHLTMHAKLAESIGIARENIFVLEDGDILEVGPQQARKNGKVSAGHIYVDGLSVGDIDSEVIRTRRTLSRDGIVMAVITVDKKTGKLSAPADIISRGFIDSKGSQDLIEESRSLVRLALGNSNTQPVDWGMAEGKVRQVLSDFYYKKTHCRPMVVPVIVKV